MGGGGSVQWGALLLPPFPPPDLPLALVLFPLLPPSLSHLLPLLVCARDMFLGFYRITITHHHHQWGQANVQTKANKSLQGTRHSLRFVLALG